MRTKFLPVLRAASIIIPGLALSFGQTPPEEAISRAVYLRGIDVRSPDNYRPNSVPVEVRILNTSEKPIYAFKIKVTAFWADGATSSSESTADLAGNYFSADRGPKPDRTSIFRRGETYAYRCAFEPRNGIPPASATALITMVAFGDRTAIGAPEDIEGLSLARMNQAAQHLRTAAELRLIIDAPDPLAAAIARSKQPPAQQHEPPAADAAMPQGHPSNAPFRADNNAEMMVKFVRSVHGDRSRIGKALADHLASADLLKLHSALRPADP